MRGFESELGIDSLVINNIPIGNLSTRAHLSQDKLELQLENELNGKKTIYLGGNLLLENQEFDLNGELTNAELAIFEPFLWLFELAVANIFCSGHPKSLQLSWAL